MDFSAFSQTEADAFQLRVRSKRKEKNKLFMRFYVSLKARSIAVITPEDQGLAQKPNSEI